jgi:hypothetical protein
MRRHSLFFPEGLAEKTKSAPYCTETVFSFLYHIPSSNTGLSGSGAEEFTDMKMCRALCSISALTLLAISQPFANAQALSDSTTSQTQTEATTAQGSGHLFSSRSASLDLDLDYHRPSEREKVRNYAFDSFGPYAFLGSALSAGFAQAQTASHAQTSGIPPDWGQGWDSYGARFGSDFGINLITQTTRYSLAEAFRQDTIFYRCKCTGFVPRLKHALISTITARKGEDGHRVFSFPALVAPYAGTEAAALLWYPRRYDAMDGFRMGNYNLLAQAGLNLALEFIYGGPHTLLSHHHVPVLSNATGSQSNQQ